jgi:hypothetical protein
MSNASSSEPYSTGRYNPDYLPPLEKSGESKPQLSLCTETLDPPALRREESKLVGLYAITIFSSLLLLSGLGVMLSEDIPKWISTAQNQAIEEPHNHFYQANNITLADTPTTLATGKMVSNTTITFPKLPKQFDPVWTQHTFDKAHQPVTILILKTPFKISQTTKQSGLEYFTYNAYLLRQVASQIQDKALQLKISQLATLSDRMAASLETAIYSEFNGMPSNALTHLQVKANAEHALQSITENPLQIFHSDRLGNALKSPGQNAFQPGYELQAYLDTLKDIIRSPIMRQEYPDTTALLISQGNRLQKTSKNLYLRWESHFSCLKATCQKSPNDARVYSMHIYVKQAFNDTGT